MPWDPLGTQVVTLTPALPGIMRDLRDLRDLGLEDLGCLGDFDLEDLGDFHWSIFSPDLVIQRR